MLSHALLLCALAVGELQLRKLDVDDDDDYEPKKTLGPQVCPTDAEDMPSTRYLSHGQRVFTYLSEFSREIRNVRHAVVNDSTYTSNFQQTDELKLFSREYFKSVNNRPFELIGQNLCETVRSVEKISTGIDCADGMWIRACDALMPDLGRTFDELFQRTGLVTTGDPNVVGSEAYWDKNGLRFVLIARSNSYEAIFGKLAVVIRKMYNYIAETNGNMVRIVDTQYKDIEHLLESFGKIVDAVLSGYALKVVLNHACKSQTGEVEGVNESGICAHGEQPFFKKDDWERINKKVEWMAKTQNRSTPGAILRNTKVYSSLIDFMEESIRVYKSFKMHHQLSRVSSLQKNLEEIKDKLVKWSSAILPLFKAFVQSLEVLEVLDEPSNYENK